MLDTINKVFVTGGIGTGIFFLLHGDGTMTRNESRQGVLTEYKDYCKAHIISHYIAALTKTKGKETEVFVIGMVGQDDAGAVLKREMQSIGINTKFVEATDKGRTMFSVCYQYPDGAGGNITTSNSACDFVTPEYIENCAGGIDCHSLVLAAPEVPLSSRIRLLEIGRDNGAFTVSSFLAGEAAEFEQRGGFALSDLVSVNIDEIIAAGGSPDEAAKKIMGINPNIKLAVTAGAGGSYIYENGDMTAIACIKEKIVSTAGAGDAYLGGTVAGLIRGMDFKQAAKYGAVTARFSVLSPDTIAKETTLENVENYISMH